jgi:serine/threonine protein kinase
LWAGRLLLVGALLVALLTVVEHRRRRMPPLEDATTARRHVRRRQPNAPTEPLPLAPTARGKASRNDSAPPLRAWSADMPTPIRQLVPQRESVPLVVDPRGDQLAGRYQLLSPLGRGHCADVYLAQSFVPGASGTVALKLLSPGVERAGYLEAARRQRRIVHPNVVRVLDVSDDELAYVAMEYVEGCTLEVLLRDLLARDEPLPPPRSVAMVAAICRALDAARPLVHGAVKPSNVLVGRRNLVKLSDFGAPPSPSDRHAPEQHVGKRPDRRSDVYAVGVILHELVTARRVELPADDARHWPPLPAPSSLRHGVPRALDAVVQKATCFGPRGRHSTAGDLLDHLLRATGDATPAVGAAWLGDWVDRARRLRQ